MIKLISVIALFAMSACSGGSHEPMQFAPNIAIGFISNDVTH